MSQVPNHVLDGLRICTSDLPPDEQMQLDFMAAMEREASTGWERRQWRYRRKRYRRLIARRLLGLDPPEEQD